MNDKVKIKKKRLEELILEEVEKYIEKKNEVYFINKKSLKENASAYEMTSGNIAYGAAEEAASLFVQKLFENNPIPNEDKYAYRQDIFSWLFDQAQEIIGRSDR
jgi:hypothetical protein